MQGEGEKENNNNYVGLGSSKEAREEEARNAEERAKSGSKRAPGSFGMKLYHQADSVSCAMVEHAHKATAKASNTLHIENRPADAIRRAIVTIEVSEVEEIRQDGGQVAAGGSQMQQSAGDDLRCTQPWTGKMVRMCVPWWSTMTKDCCRGKNASNSREKIRSNASAQVHVDAFYDARTNAHVQPSKTPHPATAIIVETFTELAAAPCGPANNEHSAGEE